jgi:diguanylate cyclase (GGDEF)-like protein
MKVAERCHRLIEKQRIPHEKSDVGPFVTASLGVGTIRSSAEIEVKDFIKAVDKLLYKAKQNGRNRIESDSP